MHAQALGLRSEVHLVANTPSNDTAHALLQLATALNQPLGEAPNSGIAHYHSHIWQAALGGFRTLLRARLRDGKWPFVCPPGATTTESTLGYVNAMYELEEDILAGRLPCIPDTIYVPAGSGGTFIGVLIGCKAIPLFRDHGTRVIGVDSGSGRPWADRKNHFDDVTKLLSLLTAGEFPRVETTRQELEDLLDPRYGAAGYGVPTPKDTNAQQLLAKDGLTLETTYSAKAMARMIDDATSASRKEDRNLLFWNTHSPSKIAHQDVSPHPKEAAQRDLVRNVLGSSVDKTYFAPKTGYTHGRRL